MSQQYTNYAENSEHLITQSVDWHTAYLNEFVQIACAEDFPCIYDKASV